MLGHKAVGQLVCTRKNGVGCAWRSSEGDYYCCSSHASGAFSSLDDASTLPCIATVVHGHTPPEIPTMEKCDILLRFSLLQSGGLGVMHTLRDLVTVFQLKMLGAAGGRGRGRLQLLLLLLTAQQHCT